MKKIQILFMFVKFQFLSSFSDVDRWRGFPSVCIVGILGAGTRFVSVDIIRMDSTLILLRQVFLQRKQLIGR